MMLDALIDRGVRLDGQRQRGCCRRSGTCCNSPRFTDKTTLRSAVWQSRVMDERDAASEEPIRRTGTHQSVATDGLLEVAVKVVWGYRFSNVHSSAVFQATGNW